MNRRILLLFVLALAAPFCLAATAGSDKPRVIVLSDIGNEPDDAESLVRFLLYTNEFDVEGLVATTSTWHRTMVSPELMQERVRAYGQVLPNLKAHAAGYPEMQALLSLIKSGSAKYGMSGVGEGKDTEASRLIIASLDRDDPRPLWITIWGGAADLAQALRTVRATRTPDQVAKLVSKLRVYSISDQDDAGSWIRANFPRLFWIVSTHAFSDYRLATWTGISAPLPGADSASVAKEWLEKNIRRGPLGALYPLPMFIMEGDTGSFLYLIPNGLGSSEHPDWGSWGGRYARVGPYLGIWGDTTDAARGVDGVDYTTNQATIWRWRQAFQNDFAARMAWTMTRRKSEANHAPVVMLNGTSGLAPVEITECANRPIKLSATGSSDPDGNKLTYQWWQYREASTELNPQDLKIEGASTSEATVVAPPARKPSFNVDLPAETHYHIIVSVTDDGQPALTRYRRVIVTVPTAVAALNQQAGAAADTRVANNRTRCETPH